VCVDGNTSCRLASGGVELIAGDAPKTMKHDRRGIVSLVGPSESSTKFTRPSVGSQFLILLNEENGHSLDEKHTPIGEVVEGLEVLDKLDALFVDDRGRPLVDVRVTHTIVLDDPFDDPAGLPSGRASPPPGRPPQETVEERLNVSEASASDKPESEEVVKERLADEEAKSRAVVLEMVGDLPDADAAPPDSVLFVCKLNPVTR
jgi:peptidyl-prolyl cis-trans isomerase-like 4